MRSRLVGTVALAAVCAARIAANAEDWSEWRGSGRNGVLRECPPLVDSVSTQGLKLLWQIPIPGGGDGNYSSAVGAKGKGYIHVSWLMKEPIATRQIDKEVLKRLGDVPPLLSDELVKKIDAARLSEERKARSGDALNVWVRDWIAENLTAESTKGFAKFAEERLRRGPETIAISVYRRLAALGVKNFAGQEELDKWLADANIDAADRKLINNAVTKDRPYREDAMVCVDMAKGAIVWKKGYRLGSMPGPSSNTPCVHGGRVYFVGCGGTLYCLNAENGEEVWKTPGVSQGGCDGSPTVIDGSVMVQTPNGLVSVDCETGRLFWRNDTVRNDSNSPSVWKHGGKSYLIAAGPELKCVDPVDGKVKWSAPGGKWTTPAVCGDTMAFMFAEKELAVYRLSPKGPTEVARVPLGFRACSPVTDGKYVWASVSRESVCIDAESGQVVWKAKGHSDIYASPFLADGKLICNHGRGVVVRDAKTGTDMISAPAGFAECISAGLVDGKLLARSATHLTCYNLAKSER